MHQIFIFLTAIIWLAGVCIRIYKQARFFQIEEYMNLRYLRWWIRAQDRFIPSRPIIVTGIGAALALFLSEAPNSPLPGFISTITAFVAVLPPNEGEIKKKFQRTQRATRLLGASFFSAVFTLSLGVFLISQLHITAQEFQLIAMMGLGLFFYLAAPLLLVSGNLLMVPIEALFRRRYVTTAKQVIANIHPKVIGITGSYGKTTTKNFITEILNGRYKAYATPKSYNTLMGICLAINKDLVDDYSIDYFIVEMGAYIQGEIKRICEVTPPYIGVLVEVGPQHLERFGSLENIAAAKYEIIKALPPDGLGVFNWDNPYTREMYNRGYPNSRIAVSKSIAPASLHEDGPRFIASEIQERLEGLSFRVTDVETQQSEIFITAVIGEHNVMNILLATAIAIHEGMALRDVALRVRQLKSAESRLVRQTTAQGITIINDAYSANPAGIISALKVLGMHNSGKRLLITPGMIELGELQETENKKLGEIAAQYATDIILVGKEQTAPIKAGLEAVHFPGEQMLVVDELREAVEWYQSHLKPGDTVLFLNDLPDTY